jgi:hypothetical protein
MGLILNPYILESGGEGEGPTADYTFSGSGDPNANGDYFENGTRNSRPKYDHETDPNYELSWDPSGPSWVITQTPGSTADYFEETFTDSATPTLGFYDYFGGPDPGGTLTAAS